MKILDPVAYAIRRDTILQHARHLFASKGFAETSMDDIARVCKIQKASLYHYFKSKDALLQELVDKECARWTAHFKEYAQGKDLRETLQTIARAFIDDLQDPSRRDLIKILYFESHKNPAILKALKRSPTSNREGFRSFFARHLQNRLNSRQVAMFVTQFMGALFHYAASAKLRGENMCLEPFNDQEYIQQLVSIYVKGIT